MKCSSCQIEIVSRDHYSTKLHAYNTKLKLHNIPPVASIEEVKEELPKTDISYKKFDQKHNCIKITKEIHEMHGCFICDKKFLSLNLLDDHLETHEVILECYICDLKFEEVDDLDDHLQDHNIPYDVYSICILKKTCLFCNVVIKDLFNYKQHLKKYFINGLKQDGAYATLENGKVIGNREYVKYFKQVLRKIDPKETRIMKNEESKVEVKIKNVEKRNNLKVSLAMNYQKHFRAHWLQ